MCTCGPSRPCELTAGQHCSGVLLRITPQSRAVCVQTLRAFLKNRPIPAGCRLDVTAIFNMLCTPMPDNADMYQHHYEAVCAEIAANKANFTEISSLLSKRGPQLSLSSFRHFCETVPKLSKKILFHPTQRNLVSSRGVFNIFDKPSLLAGVKNAGPHGLPLTALGGAYKGVGVDVWNSIESGAFVTIAGRVYSTDVAPLAIPGALSAWSTGLRGHTPQKNL